MDNLHIAQFVLIVILAVSVIMVYRKLNGKLNTMQESVNKNNVNFMNELQITKTNLTTDVNDIVSGKKALNNTKINGNVTINGKLLVNASSLSDAQGGGRPLEVIGNPYSLIRFATKTKSKSFGIDQEGNVFNDMGHGAPYLGWYMAD